MILHEGIRITGEVNKTIYDTGLESTEKQPKRLISILAQVNAYKGNNLEGWIEKTRIFNIPDELIDTTESEATTLMPKSAQRINEIPVEIDLSVGEVFKAAIRCGATATNFIGAYVYEITGA